MNNPIIQFIIENLPIVISSSTSMIFLITLLYVLLHPEVAEKWGAIISRAFIFLGTSWERRTVGLKIQGTLNTQIRKMNKEARDILPYRMKVKWVKAEDIDSEVRGGNVIVIMSHYKNTSVNIARAALAYTSKGLIPKARDYVEPNLMRTLDYTIARKLASENTGAQNLLTAMFEEEASENPDLKNWMDMINPVDEQGYVTRILLHDYSIIGEICTGFPTDTHYKETAELAHILYRLATKKPDERVNPFLIGKYIKTAIIPIAKEYLPSLDSHIRAVRRLKANGVNVFHVVAAGVENPRIAEDFMKRAIKELGLVEVKPGEKYRGFYRGFKRPLFHAILMNPTEETLTLIEKRGK